MIRTRALLVLALALVCLYVVGLYWSLHAAVNHSFENSKDETPMPINERMGARMPKLDDAFANMCSANGLPQTGNGLVMVYHPSKLFVSIVPKGGATVAAQMVFREANRCQGDDSVCNKGVKLHNDRERLSGVNNGGNPEGADQDFRPIPCTTVCRKKEWNCIKLVRSPLDRVVSSYFFMMNLPNYKNWKALNETSQSAGRSGWTASFADFIHAARVGETRFIYADHYLPQTRHDECIDDLILLLTETIVDGVEHVAELTDNRLRLNATGLTSSHYIPKAKNSNATAAIDWTHMPFPGKDKLPPQDYSAYLQNKTLNAMICQMFCADFQAYARACSQPWLSKYPNSVKHCQAEKSRVTRTCGPAFGALFHA